MKISYLHGEGLFGAQYMYLHIVFVGFLNLCFENELRFGKYELVHIFLSLRTEKIKCCNQCGFKVIYAIMNFICSLMYSCC